MNAGGEHLREHPRVGADRRFVDARDRHVDDDGGCSVATLGGAARGKAAHVFRETFDVEGGVLHVIADVVGEGLGVFHALIECAGRAGMGAGVIDGLTLLEQFDRAVDPVRLGR